MTARRLGGVLALPLVLTLVLGAGGCSGGAPRPAAPQPERTTVGPAAPQPERTAAGPAAPQPVPEQAAAYPVGLRVLPLRRGADRPLPTLVFYPAADRPGSATADAGKAGTDRRPADHVFLVRADARHRMPRTPPAIMRQVRRHGTLTHAALGGPPAAGRFPLVVFSHGLSGSPEWCAAALAAWASAGFVVAAPTFPYTSEFARKYRRGDIVNQPDDVRFVLERVRRLDVTAGDALRGRIDGDRVAAVGHSAGGYTTSGLFTAGHDPRLRAGVIMAGWAAPGAFAGPPADMLFVHGTADPVVPVRTGRAAYERVPWPKSYVLMRRVSHANYLRPGHPGFRRATSAVTTFLRRTLRAGRTCGSPAQWDACFAVPSPLSSR